MSEPESAESIVFIAPGAGIEIRPLDAARDKDAAPILAACTFEATTGRGQSLLAELRADPASTIYGLSVDGELVAVYSLRRVEMAVEVSALAVAEGQRRKGYGRACLTDALRRAGTRPLVLETDEEALGFYKACGFKLVGRRKHASGTVRYRMGWHAPGLRFKGGSTGRMGLGE